MAINLYWKARLSNLATRIHEFVEPTATKNIMSENIIPTQQHSLAVEYSKIGKRAKIKL